MLQRRKDSLTTRRATQRGEKVVLLTYRSITSCLKRLPHKSIRIIKVVRHDVARVHLSVARAPLSVARAPSLELVFVIACSDVVDHFHQTHDDQHRTDSCEH